MPDPTWVFPDGTPDQVVTDSDGLGLGPMFLYDVMQLQWTPSDQQVTVQLSCDQNGGGEFIGENTYDSSPSYWDLTQVPSDENPACHFAFKDAEHGNAKYFQYVHTANDAGSTTWSASAAMTALPNTPVSSPESTASSTVGDPVSQSSSVTTSQGSQTTKAPEASAKPSLSVSTVVMSVSAGGFQTIVTSIPVAPPAAKTGVRPASAPSTISGGLPLASPSQSSASSSTSPPQKSTNTTAIGVGVGASVGAVACIAALIFFLYSQRKKRKARGEKQLVSSRERDGRLNKVSPSNNPMGPRTGYSNSSEGGLMPVGMEQHLAAADQKSASTVSYPYVSELGGNVAKGYQAQTAHAPYPQVSELGGNSQHTFAQAQATVPAPPSYSYELATQQRTMAGTRNHAELA